MAESRSRLDVRRVVSVLGDFLRFASSTLRPRVQLAAENLFLRKQLALYVEGGVNPRRANDATRLTLVGLLRLTDWRQVLIVVKPETLIRWHRKGFRLFLAMEIAASWPTAGASQGAAIDRRDGGGEPDLG